LQTGEAARTELLSRILREFREEPHIVNKRNNRARTEIVAEIVRLVVLRNLPAGVERQGPVASDALRRAASSTGASAFVWLDRSDSHHFGAGQAAVAEDHQLRQELRATVTSIQGSKSRDGIGGAPRGVR